MGAGGFFTWVQHALALGDVMLGKGDLRTSTRMVWPSMHTHQSCCTEHRYKSNVLLNPKTLIEGALRKRSHALHNCFRGASGPIIGAAGILTRSLPARSRRPHRG